MKEKQRREVVKDVMDFLDRVEAEPKSVHTLRMTAKKTGKVTGKMDGKTATHIVDVEEEHHQEVK